MTESDTSSETQSGATSESDTSTAKVRRLDSDDIPAAILRLHPDDVPLTIAGNPNPKADDVEEIMRRMKLKSTKLAVGQFIVYHTTEDDRAMVGWRGLRFWIGKLNADGPMQGTGDLMGRMVHKVEWYTTNNRKKPVELGRYVPFEAVGQSTVEVPVDDITHTFPALGSENNIPADLQAQLRKYYRL